MSVGFLLVYCVIVFTLVGHRRCLARCHVLHSSIPSTCVVRCSVCCKDKFFSTYTFTTALQYIVPVLTNQKRTELLFTQTAEIIESTLRLKVNLASSSTNLHLYVHYSVCDLLVSLQKTFMVALITPSAGIFRHKDASLTDFGRVLHRDDTSVFVDAFLFAHNL